MNATRETWEFYTRKYNVFLDIRKVGCIIWQLTSHILGIRLYPNKIANIFLSTSGFL